MWRRKGWAEMDKMRSKLEDLKELRDLVRSLGRGGGWGPLRRAPIQYLDMKVRARHKSASHSPIVARDGAAQNKPSRNPGSVRCLQCYDVALRQCYS